MPLQANSGSSVLVQQVARLIRTFDQQQIHQLFELVPEIREAKISDKQAELMAYFQVKVEASPTQKPLQDDDIFIGGLTVAEFFALPEYEQDRVWQQAHRQYETYSVDKEQPVQADAIPS